MSASSPTLQQTDTTPFRLTPNVQDFITPTGMEGLVTSALLSLSRGLLEPEVHRFWMVSMRLLMTFLV